MLAAPTQPRLLECRHAIPELTANVYGEFRRLAAQFLRRAGSDHSFQPTALVHKAYIRLAGWKDFWFQSRAQFFGAASFVMRRVLTEAGRQRATLKLGVSIKPVDRLDELEVQAPAELVGILAIDQALPHRRLLERLTGNGEKTLDFSQGLARSRANYLVMNREPR